MSLHVLMITSEWPTPSVPHSAQFVAQQVHFLRGVGVEVDVFHFRGGKKLLNYIRAWRGVRQLLSSRSYDLIHAQWGQSAVLALPKRLPLVVTFRGTDLEGFVGDNGKYTVRGRVLSMISRWVASLADSIIVVSEQLGRHLGNRTYDVIPSGLNLELFRPIPQAEARRQLSLPTDKLLILFAGTPSRPLKRFHLAQQAIARLNGNLTVQLVVAAGVPHNMMPLYMSACDVLLLTSSHEGSPNVVKEALACDLPVVSVDVGDVRHRLRLVEGCVLCTDDRPETIASGLRSVLTRNRRLDGRNAVRDLDERILAQKVLSVYKVALSGTSAQDCSGERS